MFRRLIAVLVLLLSLLTPLPAASAQRPAAPLTVQQKDCTVYITRTGKRYHREGCRYLRGGAVAMTREEALKRGLSPCRVCGGSDCER